MFNSCAFPPPHGMGGSERLSSGAWVGTSLPSPVLLGTRQPRRGEAAPAEPAAGLGQSRAGQGRGQLCVLRGSALRPPRHLQVDREGCAAPGWDCRTCSFRLKTAGWADCLRGEAPWSVASWQLILAKARKRPSACPAVLSWSAAFLWLQLPAPFPGRGQCPGRTHGPPNIMAGPPRPGTRGHTRHLAALARHTHTRAHARPLPWQVLCPQCSPSTLSSITSYLSPQWVPRGCVSPRRSDHCSRLHSRNPPHSRTGALCFVTRLHCAGFPSRGLGICPNAPCVPHADKQWASDTTGPATDKRTLQAQCYLPAHASSRAPARASSFPKTSPGSGRGLLVGTSCSVCLGVLAIPPRPQDRWQPGWPQAPGVSSCAHMTWRTHLFTQTSQPSKENTPASDNSGSTFLPSS